MKKTLLLTAVAIVAITGCSKNEVTYQKSPADNAITFRTVISKQSKATEATATVLQDDGNGYKSVAYATEAEFASNTKALTAYFNETIRFANGAWNADNTLYWPKSGKMSLFSYYPCVNTNLTTIVFTDAKYENATLTYPKLDFTVSNVLADQVDLLAANEMNKAKDDNNAGLQVNFKHILSQLYFKAKTSDASYKVKVKSITVAGATKTAAFAYDGSNTVGVWSGNAETQEYKYRESAFPTADGALIDNTATTVNSEGDKGSLMIIPQAAGSDFKFTVVYDIYTPTGALLKGDVSKDALMENFAMGKKYAYVLTLPIPVGGGGDDDITPITFSIDISDWDNEVTLEQSFAQYELSGTASEYEGAIASLVNEFNTYRNNLAGTYKHTIKVIEAVDKTIATTLTIDLTELPSANLGSDDVVVLDFSAITTLSETVKVVVTSGNNWTATPAELTAAGTITLKKK